MTNSCSPMDCSPPGSSVHGILQARILQWVAMPSSRGSSRSKDQIHVSCRRNRYRRYFTPSLSVWITLSYEFVSILRSRKGCVCVCVCVCVERRVYNECWWTTWKGTTHGDPDGTAQHPEVHSSNVDAQTWEMCSGAGWAPWGGPVTEKGSSEVSETGNMEIRTGKEIRLD